MSTVGERNGLQGVEMHDRDLFGETSGRLQRNRVCLCDFHTVTDQISRLPIRILLCGCGAVWRSMESGSEDG